MAGMESLFVGTPSLAVSRSECNAAGLVAGW